MRVGIITTFRQPNWGSVLQAYALEKVIEQMNYDVEVIDYKYPNEFHWQRGKKWGKNPNTLKAKLHKIKVYFLCMLKLRSKPMMELLNSFIKKNMKLSRKIDSYESLHENPPIYDIYVSGSDQIWNPNTMLGDMSYMFDFVPNGNRKISYASSFSCVSIPNSLKDIYKNNLSTYSVLSVRENNGQNIIRQLIGKDAKVVLDPTLLLTKEHWEKLAEKAKKTDLPKTYILCYMLAYTFSADEPMGKLLEMVQRKYNMPVIALKTMPQSFHGDIFQLPVSYSKGIEEFLYLINNASIVVSSSFHGTAFSLNLGKPLVAMGAMNEDDRVLSLLKNLGMKNQFVYAEKLQESSINPFYDVENEQKKMEELRFDSLSFLRNSLKDCEHSNLK